MPRCNEAAAPASVDVMTLADVDGMELLVDDGKTLLLAEDGVVLPTVKAACSVALPVRRLPAAEEWATLPTMLGPGWMVCSTSLMLPPTGGNSGGWPKSMLSCRTASSVRLRSAR